MYSDELFQLEEFDLFSFLSEFCKFFELKNNNLYGKID